MRCARWAWKHGGRPRSPLWRDGVYISPASTVGRPPCSWICRVAGITSDLGVPLPERGWSFLGLPVPEVTDVPSHAQLGRLVGETAEAGLDVLFHMLWVRRFGQHTRDRRMPENVL